jgi:predicted metal-dependent HD superfamily phosphohydrolase
MIQASQAWHDFWHKAWSEITHGDAGDALFTALLTAYAEPQRHYHTLQHLQECMEHFASSAHLAQHPHEVAVALWFHDAIYDTHAHNNEAASAQWAVQALRSAGAQRDVCARIEALIMATQHSAAPATPDACLLVDIDLSILGAVGPRFAQYEAQIKREYSFVDAAIFNLKRAEILRDFLARENIYSTPFFNQQLEAKARENLARSIQLLVPVGP